MKTVREKFDSIWDRLNENSTEIIDDIISKNITDLSNTTRFLPSLRRINLDAKSLNELIEEFKSMSDDKETFFNSLSDDIVDVQLNNAKLNLYFSIIEEKEYFLIKHNGRNEKGVGFCCLLVSYKKNK